MIYVIIAAAGLVAGLAAGYMIGTAATLKAIQTFIESETDYVKRN